MQTTLLGLAMTLILALIAALIGPYFIDWNQFRPQFEAEATRVIGTPVRVEGALDARLLPSPILRLRGVTIGRSDGPGQTRADKLDVEFSLGALMRGEWRATELTVNGVALALGLDAQGRIDWPAASAFSNLGALAIDRLAVTGRLALHDAASGRSVELSDIAFSGDVRPQTGSVRGDGNFLLSGTRYPFRLSSGRVADGSATRLHLTLDPGDRALFVDLDGLLTVEAKAPRFDGAIIVAAPASKTEPSLTPWRIAARLKANPAAARLDQIEASYGAEDIALKLTGAADLGFGVSPRFHAALSAKQLDLDRVLAKEIAAGETPRWPAGLLGLIGQVPPAPLPVQLEISAEKVLIGGRAIENVEAELRGDASAWMIDSMALRAPGGSQVAINRGTVEPGPTTTFKGALSLESADPDLLAVWLLGRGDPGTRTGKPLRLRGDVALSATDFAVERLTASIDGGTLEGRIARTGLPAGGTRLEAALKGDRLDLDAAAAIVRSLAGPQPEWPVEGSLALDFGRAISGGQSWQPFVARLGYGPAAITLEQLKIGAAGGLTVEGAGAFDRAAATGRLALNASATTLPQIAAALTPVAPSLAARLTAMGEAPGAVRVRLAVDLDKNPADGARVRARAVVGIDAPQLKGETSFFATPSAVAVRGTDLEALLRGEVRVETRLSAPRGQSLLALLGLQRVAAAGAAPMLLEGSARGTWGGSLQLIAKLAGADLEAQIDGSADPWAVAPVADLKLAIRRANLAPLFDLRPSDTAGWNVSLSSRLAVAGSKLGFNEIDGSVVGARLRGRLAVTLGDEHLVDGEAGVDTLDLAPALQLALGISGRDGSAPLGRGLSSGWRGQVAFQALRAVLPGGAELRPLSGVVRSDGRSLTLDALKGKIGGGDVKADLNARPSPEGLALTAHLEFAGVDGTALRYRTLTMPAGRAALQMTLSSAGRSASALAGALAGGGSLTIDAAAIAGLDPRAFEVAIRASDAGQPTDETKLAQLVEPVLSAGALPVVQAQFPFSIRDGRLRVDATTLTSTAAQAIVSGGFDLTAEQVDLRASLASTAAATGSLRPEILIFSAGPPDRLHRTVDVAALSAWLAVRRIDREIGKLESLERNGAPPAAAPPAIPPGASPLPGRPPPPMVNVAPDSEPRRPPIRPRPAAPRPPSRDVLAPLPPAIEVRPAPGSARPARGQPLVLTPPPSSLPRGAF